MGNAMSQNNRIFDDLGRLMNEAAGVADGVRREVETVVKSQAQRFVADMDLVKREDFDALRELVQVQGEEIDALRKELAALKGAQDQSQLTCASPSSPTCMAMRWRWTPCWPISPCRASMPPCAWATMSAVRSIRPVPPTG